MKKHVLIGITGGIAAYKSLYLIRMFVKNGYEVKVMATEHAMQFVTRLSVETLSCNDLYVDMFSPAMHRTTGHISLAQWADVCVIAPATANMIGKMAHGIADDAVSTTCMALSCPLFVAPAMNEQMLHNKAVEENISLLKQRGVHIVASRSGFLACNAYGDGRMAEPEDIFKEIHAFLQPANAQCKGLKAMVSAGGTQEAIDAVRYIGNRSSGLMGFALAEALACQGVEVDLVTAPTHLIAQHPLIHRIDVESAEQMLQACTRSAQQADIVIMAAAVADYTPATKYGHKLKKQSQNLTIELKPTVDILKTLSLNRTKKQWVTGFALETDDEIENARKKLTAKKLDMVVLNSLKDKGAGFSTPTNKVLILDADGSVLDIPLQSKPAVAAEIVKHIFEKLNLTYHE
ncbi:MAG: bifunctional phosphopantothenoylcysteine decarboxylase/phosphopantothenate--cysteine ligase CoaBC [Bacteroidales bacterium]|nr:bifunctional phosphopantothenoylcysteine decarboxylase/phosphopantothenate--cysteine ligase CoaBC [Bacteroidales bacterium]